MKKIVICMLAGLMTGAAVAEETKEPEMLAAEAEFVSLDANKNGALSKQEADLDAKLAAAFAEADADQDGEISKAEYILYSGDATAAGG